MDILSWSGRNLFFFFKNTITGQNVELACIHLLQKA